MLARLVLVFSSHCVLYHFILYVIVQIQLSSGLCTHFESILYTSSFVLRRLFHYLQPFPHKRLVSFPGRHQFALNKKDRIHPIFFLYIPSHSISLSVFCCKGSAVMVKSQSSLDSLQNSLTITNIKNPRRSKVSARTVIFNSKYQYFHLIPVNGKRKGPSILCGTLMGDLSENTPIYRIPLDWAIK